MSAQGITKKEALFVLGIIVGIIILALIFGWGILNLGNMIYHGVK